MSAHAHDPHHQRAGSDDVFPITAHHNRTDHNTAGRFTLLTEEVRVCDWTHGLLGSAGVWTFAAVRICHTFTAATVLPIHDTTQSRPPAEYTLAHSPPRPPRSSGLVLLRRGTGARRVGVVIPRTGSAGTSTAIQPLHARPSLCALEAQPADCAPIPIRSVLAH